MAGAALRLSPYFKSLQRPDPSSEAATTHWEKRRLPSLGSKLGETFYFNCSTGESSWERPAGYIDVETDFAPAALLAALPEDWTLQQALQHLGLAEERTEGFGSAGGAACLPPLALQCSAEGDATPLHSSLLQLKLLLQEQARTDGALLRFRLAPAAWELADGSPVDAVQAPALLERMTRMLLGLPALPSETFCLTLDTLLLYSCNMCFLPLPVQQFLGPLWQLLLQEEASATSASAVATSTSQVPLGDRLWHACLQQLQAICSSASAASASTLSAVGGSESATGAAAVRLQLCHSVLSFLHLLALLALTAHAAGNSEEAGHVAQGWMRDLLRTVIQCSEEAVKERAKAAGAEAAAAASSTSSTRDEQPLSLLVPELLPALLSVLSALHTCCIGDTLGKESATSSSTSSSTPSSAGIQLLLQGEVSVSSSLPYPSLHSWTALLEQLSSPSSATSFLQSCLHHSSSEGSSTASAASSHTLNTCNQALSRTSISTSGIFQGSPAEEKVTGLAAVLSLPLESVVQKLAAAAEAVLCSSGNGSDGEAQQPFWHTAFLLPVLGSLSSAASLIMLLSLLGQYSGGSGEGSAAVSSSPASSFPLFQQDMRLLAALLLSRTRDLPVGSLHAYLALAAIRSLLQCPGWRVLLDEKGQECAGAGAGAGAAMSSSSSSSSAAYSSAAPFSAQLTAFLEELVQAEEDCLSAAMEGLQADPAAAVGDRRTAA